MCACTAASVSNGRMSTPRAVRNVRNSLSRLYSSDRLQRIFYKHHRYAKHRLRLYRLQSRLERVVCLIDTGGDGKAPAHPVQERVKVRLP